jgi:hypothetical protein
MSRTLTLLFRRDPSRDRQTDTVQLEGYQPLWPDGKPVAVAMDAFCKHGLRLLGLGKNLAGCHQKLVNMIFLPLSGREDHLNRIPGHRVRRFYLHRTGNTGRVHFLDGTPTLSIFDVGRDDPRVIHWIGLNSLEDGEILWFDLAAVAADAVIAPRQRLQALEV